MKAHAQSQPENPREFSAIVIGGGFAGAAAVHRLKLSGMKKVVLVEAHSMIGGRTMNSAASKDPSISQFCPYPIELGGEFLHGDEKNSIYDYIHKKGLRNRPDARAKEVQFPNYYYLGKEGRLVNSKQMEDDEDMQLLYSAFDSIEDLNPHLIPEETLLQYFSRLGVKSRVLDLAYPLYANDYAAELCEVGLKETVVEQQQWEQGEKYLVLQNCTMKDVIDDMVEGAEVICNWKVQSVDYSGSGRRRVKVTNDKGEALLADRAIVTVPLPFLRAPGGAGGELAFAPALPADKAAAARSVQMGEGVKIILRMRGPRFWPQKDLWSILCADTFAPEVWIGPVAVILDGKDLPVYHVVGLICGSRVRALRGVPGEEQARLLLAQLDAMFGSQMEPRPATKAYDGAFLIKDWGQDPHAAGAYTYPSPDALGAREVLAHPLAGADGTPLVFFAGEAVHAGVNPCLNAAADTGSAAAAQLLQSLLPPRAPKL
mmetsp:Transcript_49305/g.130001  ORF Transcript_49305/g.130001 Transcript_49305/m.130001 type:complete len:486 (-) Transcript_49305:73-1530(-)